MTKEKEKIQRMVEKMTIDVFIEDADIPQLKMKTIDIFAGVGGLCSQLQEARTHDLKSAALAEDVAKKTQCLCRQALPNEKRNCADCIATGLLSLAGWLLFHLPKIRDTEQAMYLFCSAGRISEEYYHHHMPFDCLKEFEQEAEKIAKWLLVEHHHIRAQAPRSKHKSNDITESVEKAIAENDLEMLKNLKVMLENLIMDMDKFEYKPWYNKARDKIKELETRPTNIYNIRGTYNEHVDQQNISLETNNNNKLQTSNNL